VSQMDPERFFHTSPRRRKLRTGETERPDGPVSLDNSTNILPLMISPGLHHHGCSGGRDARLGKTSSLVTRSDSALFDCWRKMESNKCPPFSAG
jgi:hypothetical protein